MDFGCDSLSGDCPCFELIGKSERRFQVIAINALYGDEACRGWIDKSIEIVVDSRSYIDWIPLYWEPTVNEKKSYVVRPLGRVIDFEGLWLKIEGFDAIKQYFCGWLAPWDQCAEVYSSCGG